MQEQRAVRRAWELFLELGGKPAGIGEAIAASWQRSRQFGIAAERSEAPLAGEPEIFRRRSLNAALLKAARPALERSKTLLADASSMMILADPGGLIIDTAGDPRVVDLGRRNHLETGGRWEEGAIGTNAIGTALASAEAVQIHGAEHFCEDVQRWSCAAAPIRHPTDGELLGVIDISGLANPFNPQSLALAIAMGQEIEATLGQVARAEHEILLRQFVSKRSLWVSEEMLVIDRRGCIVHPLGSAQRRLGGMSGDEIAGNIRSLIGKATADSWEENCRRLFPNATLEIVNADDGAVGGILVMREPRRRTSGLPAATIPHAEPKVSFDQILGESRTMLEVKDRARLLAESALQILIEGETGVGKELFARAVHSGGPKPDGPFVPVNCGGMARDLIASEIFGYDKGAFTGADENGRPGKIEKAHGGLLCLDEIGEMPVDLQPYLLRVLEDGVVYRIGSHEARSVDVRVISMTNRELLAEVAGGRFRRDLYYRVAAAKLTIPPLRERGDDVLLLAERFASAAAGRRERSAPTFSDEALTRLRGYGWPGNVRELRNVIDSIIALSTSNRLGEHDLPPEIRFYTPAAAPSPSATASDLKAIERVAILTEIQACGGNLTKAAARLGVARSTLYLRLAEYGIGKPTRH
ncbi:Sigma-54-dependent Fis family transcriptional regulator [Methylocella tundrae]|uniref:Sigma-54-dependent Fis family transcriptional regulator n=1 Tax=Methylocella tundrae TaxID=227605 RepID=A0A8B6M9N9_METTU|nr:sigma-54-dependent Fis family transcriptional regulator [Methylocella tundrae]VTZ51640.1 Sigma-54-dependent Fis family transcriptional regulator [Methylocella tundrae]